MTRPPSARRAATCGSLSTPSATVPRPRLRAIARLNAHDAVYEGHSGCANGRLDSERDLAGVEHYGGPASQDTNGTFFLLDANGDSTQWAGNFTNSDGFPWSNGYPRADGYPWATGFPWSSSLADPASVNAWVPQE
jgi:hypothetical protein